MLKMVGGLLVILSTSLTGMRLASNLEKEYQELRYIRQLLYMLQSEIRYSRAFLSEAFANMAETVRSPYDVWFRQLHLRLERKMDGNFVDIWLHTIDTYLVDLKLPRRQREQLKDLGNYLGNADVDLQIKHMEVLSEQFEVAMKEMRVELENKKRLCRCLGVVSGVFLTIIFS